MISFIAIPKAFKGHIGIIQVNAIKSWTLLKPKPEIVLLGNEEGTREIAERFRLKHISNIQRGRYGGILYNSIFREGKKASSNQWLCHITSDVILTNEFIETFQRVKEEFPRCFMACRRWNLDIRELIDFSDNKWQEKLKEAVRKEGKRDGHTGSDIFIFPRNLFSDEEIPPFILGRAVFDNWIFFYAHKKVPLVDLTKMVYVIHQYHNYSYKLGGQRGVYMGKEAKHNLKLAGGYKNLFTLRDFDFEITKNGLRRKEKGVYIVYRWIISYSKFSQLLFPLICLLKFIRSRLSFYRK